MKKFTTLTLVFLILIISSESYSQTFRIKGGINFAQMPIDSDIVDSKILTGFHLGATSEFSLTEMFSFETGLLLSTKGTKFTTETGQEKYNLTYLDIPLTAKASFMFEGLNIFGIFGPYLGVGLGGKYYDGEERKIQWGTSVDADGEYLKQLDYGLILGAGVELKPIEIELTYGLGLADIMGDSSYKISNRVLSISVGYKFGEK